MRNSLNLQIFIFNLLLPYIKSKDISELYFIDKLRQKFFFLFGDWENFAINEP